jgi:ribosome-associated heat shock protein Hsp15
MTSADVRIDKFLWAVRIYKTRTLAAEACDKGRVIIDGNSVKSSRHIKTGDILLISKPPVIHTFKILKVLSTRLSAELVKQYIEELTSAEEFLKAENLRLQKNPARDRGAGRPTKRDRRKMDDAFGNELI